jgi:hypothetical protein
MCASFFYLLKFSRRALIKKMSVLFLRVQLSAMYRVKNLYCRAFLGVHNMPRAVLSLFEDAGV